MLDLGKVLIQWNGPNCNIAEKSRVSKGKSTVVYWRYFLITGWEKKKRERERHIQNSVFVKMETVFSVCTVRI